MVSEFLNSYLRSNQCFSSRRGNPEQSGSPISIQLGRWPVQPNHRRDECRSGSQRCRSLVSPQVREQLLEAGIVAEDIVIGIVLDPVALAPSASEGALEQRERLVFMIELQVEACCVAQ